MATNSKECDDRAELEFPTHVRNAFRPLETTWAFTVVEENQTLVRYESRTVFVNVYHGRSSFEVGVKIGRLDSDKTYSLTSILDNACPEYADAYRSPCARTSNSLREAVEGVAAVLFRNESSVLSGSPDVFRRLEDFVGARIAKRELESKVTTVKPRADAAFKTGDYKQAAKLYGLIEAVLSPSEQGKLSYARRKAKVD